MPGRQYTPEEIAKAEADFNAQMGVIAAGPGSDRQKAEMIANLRAQFEQIKRSVQAGSDTNPDFVYRGTPGAAEADLARYRDMAQQARGRGGIFADYANANQQRGNSLAARGSQVDALGLYQNMAQGNGPSVAQGMYQQNLDRGIQAGASLANSARGGALALAQGRLTAQGQASNMLAGSSAQAAQLRAQEMQQAMAGYAGLASNIRAGDFQGQGADAQMAQSQATLGLQSRGQNDATGLAYEGLGQGVVGTAAQMGLAREAAMQHNVDAQTAAAQALAQQNSAESARNTQLAGTIASVVLPIAGNAVGAAAKAGQGSTTTADGFTHLNSSQHTLAPAPTPVVPVQPQQTGTSLYDPNDPRWKTQARRI